MNVSGLYVNNEFLFSFFTAVQAGYTPLHTACHFGHVNVVEYLLRHGALTEAVTKVFIYLSTDL